MVAIEIGRVCKKLSGREAGRFCVVVDLIDEGYCSITGPKTLTGVKRRQCNILHLEPTETVIEVKKGASDEEVVKAYEKADLMSKVKFDGAERMRAAAGEVAEKPKAEKPKKAAPKKKKEE